MTDTTAMAVPAHVSSGLELLVQAQHYAADVGQEIWQFAVEIGLLHRRGLTRNDFRWLVHKGLVDHAVEVTQPEDERRSFRSLGRLTFSRGTCFVLTDEGTRAAGRLLSACPQTMAIRAMPGNGQGTPHVDTKPPAATVPRWDGARHELWLGDRLVKQFKLPSPNQEAILVVFDEEGWPPQIDDPLPPVPNLDPKRRLHDTIKNLNRCQKHRLIQFMGDGTGEGVRWELIAASDGSRSTPARHPA